MSAFHITTEIRGTVGILTLVGHLDAQSAVTFEREIQNVQTKELRKFVLDFSRLDYISSAGLGVFMAALQKVRERHGDMLLVQPNRYVMRLIEVMGFAGLLLVFENLDAALQKFE